MFSEKVTAQIHRSIRMIPVKEGRSTFIETTEGRAIVKNENGTISISKAHTPIMSSGFQFDRVVVINREDRKERKVALTTHLREIGWPFAEPIWHIATPGSEVTPPESWKSTKNIWAGNQSHGQIIKQAYDDGLDNVLIMEDDCIYLPGFHAKIVTLLNTIPNDWDMIYIGGRVVGQKRKLIKEPVGNGVYRIESVNNLESYVVRRKFMKEAYEMLFSTNLHSDEAFRERQHTNRTYHMLPPIAAQRAGWSDNFHKKQGEGQMRIEKHQTCGANILSTGQGRRHLLANSSASFNRNNPNLGLHIFSDKAWQGYSCTVVDKDSTGLASRQHKISIMKNSPFDKGVILDDDTITLKQLPPIEHILGDYDLAMAPDMFSSMGGLLKSQSREALAWLSREEANYTLDKFPDCDEKTHFNSGVIFYRRTEKVKNFCDVWLSEWARFKRIDQVALFRAIEITGIKVKILDSRLHNLSESFDNTYIVHLIKRKNDLGAVLKKNNLPFVACPMQKDVEVRGCISFCLFGNKPKYVTGLVENLALARKIYPGWHVSVHLEEGHHAEQYLSTISDSLTIYKQEHGLSGTFWRFNSAGDKRFTHVVFRDTDSRLNYKEKAAVDNWIESGKEVHSMADHKNHKRKMMAGMSGVCGEAAAKLHAFHNNWKQPRDRRGDDEDMLASFWDESLDNVLRHSSVESNPGQPFPQHAATEGFVGMQVETEKLCCGQRPGIKETLKGLADSFYAIASDALSGRKVKASKEERKKRMEACSKCPHLSKKMCTLCNCFVSIKTTYASRFCPDSPMKWGPEV